MMVSIKKKPSKWNKIANLKPVSTINSILLTKPPLLMQLIKSLPNFKPTNSKKSNSNKNSTNSNPNSKNSKKKETKSSTKENNSKSMSLSIKKNSNNTRQWVLYKRPKLRSTKTNWKTWRWRFQRKWLRNKKVLRITRRNVRPIWRRWNWDFSTSKSRKKNWKWRQRK